MASKRTLDHSSCFPAPKKRKGSSCFVSSSSSTQPRWTYHVFLSFSGEDTRKNFTDHLYDALDQAGIHTFRDDKLPRGREISPELLKSIERSRISIVVFSRNYASSRWCLDELVKIIECKETIGQLVLPLFYDVDPSDVRDQKRCFGVAFRRHKKRYGDEMEKVEVRRVALSKAGNIAGWVLKNVANGHEAELIRQVVEEVSCKLERTSLYVAKHPIGIESHVEHDMLSQQDQLDQAAEYIKQLKERIEELKARQALAMGNTNETNKNIKDTMMFGLRPPVVELKDLGSSLELVLISGLEKNFMLYEVISVLEHEGTEVVSTSVSTMGDRVFHTLHAQVKVTRVGVETSRVCQRLHELVC